MSRRRTPIGTQPPEPPVVPDGARLPELDERKVIDIAAQARAISERAASSPGIDVSLVSEMEADEPSGPIEPPLPYELQRLGTQPPIDLAGMSSPDDVAGMSSPDDVALGTPSPDDVAFGTPSPDDDAIGTWPPAVAPGPDDLPDLIIRFRTPGTSKPDALPDDGVRHRTSDVQFAAGTQTAAPALSRAGEGGDAHGDARADTSDFAAGTEPAARALPRARTGGGRVAATEPAKVASGTIEPTDVVPKIDPDEEHAVIVQIDEAWLDRLDLPPE